jgi:hypothetical protein
MIPTTMDMAYEVESLLRQYEEACWLFGEDSAEAKDLLRRLQSLTFTAEQRPDPEMNGDLPVSK